MDQGQIENEIRWRLYCWAQATIKREVAEDFPFLQNCQHNRDVRCFLAWMNEINPAKKLRIFLLLAASHSQRVILTKGEKLDPTAEDVFQQKYAAINRYHHLLSPTPDCDIRAPSFVKADVEKCKEAIVESLQTICGSPRRRQPQKIWYIQKFGDWFLTTLIEISRISGPEVHCYHFLRRADFDNPKFRDSRYYADDMTRNIDPLIELGISGSHFPLIGQSHEQLCAKSVRAVTEPIVRSIPKLIEGLEIRS